MATRFQPSFWQLPECEGWAGLNEYHTYCRWVCWCSPCFTASS